MQREKNPNGQQILYCYYCGCSDKATQEPVVPEVHPVLILPRREEKGLLSCKVLVMSGKDASAWSGLDCERKFIKR